jgi:hypothetical protein
MWESIISKVNTTLEGIGEIKEVFSYPLQGNPKKFPAVVYYPVSMVQNDFNSQADNFKLYTVSISIIVSLSGTTIRQVYSTILPKISDKLVQEFDEKWNMGTVDGHRVWCRLSTGDISYSQEQSGGTATMNLILEVKALTDI